MLGVYIPRRISELSDQEVLDEVEAGRLRREAILAEHDKERKATPTKRKEKVTDLTKMDSENVLIVLATEMGITVEQLKSLIAASPDK